MKKVFGWIKKYFKSLIKDQYLRYVIAYSFLYLVIALVIVGLFAYYNKSFVNYVDAFSQHIITLKYFRTLIINFLETGSFTTFTWNIGFGLDMFSNLSYYVLGDIFSYLAILVSENDLISFYNISIFFRIWLVGISFIILCRYQKIKGPGVLIGAIMYSICANTFTQGFRNPYMLNASILFPLLMIGLDRSIVHNKNIFFIIIVAINFMSGFYFAYMSSITLALYGLLIAIKTYRRDGIFKIIFILVKTFLLAIIGLLISSIFLLPAIMQFLSSSRSSEGITFYQYFAEGYHQLVGSYLNSNITYHDNRLGLSSIFLITLPIFTLQRKENYPVFLITLILIVSMFVPILSSFWVGFYFPLNRWVYMICFFLSYMTALTIKTNFSLTKKEIKVIFLFASIYFLFLFLYEASFNTQVIGQMFVLFTLVFIYANTTKLNKCFRLTNVLAPIIVFLGVGFNFYYFYSPTGNNYITSFITQSNLKEKYDNAYDKIDNFSLAIDYIKELDDSFYMIGKYPIALQNYNLSLWLDYQSISYYYSINSSYYSHLASDLQNSQYNMSYEIEEFDYRTRITTLLGNKYFVSTNQNRVPYGYELIKTMNDEDESVMTSIYQNKYPLFFGIFYNDYITEEDYDSLTEYEKEISLYKTTALSDDVINSSNLSYFSKYRKVIEKDYEILSYEKSNISSSKKADENSIKILDTDNDYIYLTTDKVKNSEVYVKISGIKYKLLSENDTLSLNLSSYSDLDINRYFYKNKWDYNDLAFSVSVDSGKVRKSESFKDKKTSPYYYEDDCVYINLGYYETFTGKVKIYFSDVGNYYYDNIEVIAVNFDNYEKDIKSLNSSNFEIINYNDGYMEAGVNNSKDGILQFATVYSDGWSVYVDDEKVDTFISNGYFLGIYLSSGEHKIKLVYETPYLKEGENISKIGVIFLIIVILSEVIIFIYKRIKNKLVVIQQQKC